MSHCCCVVFASDDDDDQILTHTRVMSPGLSNINTILPSPDYRFFLMFPSYQEYNKICIGDNFPVTCCSRELHLMMIIVVISYLRSPSSIPPLLYKAKDFDVLPFRESTRFTYPPVPFLTILIAWLNPIACNIVCWR